MTTTTKLIILIRTMNLTEFIDQIKTNKEIIDGLKTNQSTRLMDLTDRFRTKLVLKEK